MDLTLIYGNDVSVEDLIILYELGFGFDVEDGKIMRVDFPKGCKI